MQSTPHLQYQYGSQRSLGRVDKNQKVDENEQDNKNQKVDKSWKMENKFSMEMGSPSRVPLTLNTNIVLKKVLEELTKIQKLTKTKSWQKS